MSMATSTCCTRFLKSVQHRKIEKKNLSQRKGPKQAVNVRYLMHQLADLPDQNPLSCGRRKHF